jgi:hypothetical protein
MDGGDWAIMCGIGGALLAVFVPVYWFLWQWHQDIKRRAADLTAKMG